MIIVLKHLDKVYLAMDAKQIGLIGYSEHIFMNQSNLPIWNPQKDVIVCTNDLHRSVDVLRYKNLFIEEVNQKNLQMKIAPTIKEVLGAYNRLDKNNLLKGEYIIVHKDKIYLMDRHLLVSEAMPFIAIGDGSELVEEYLWLNYNENINIRDLINDVFVIKKKYDHSLSDMIYIMTMNNDKIEIDVMHLDIRSTL
jgi:hypothetical protein